MKEEVLAVFRRKKIGFVFQAFNLVSSINIWENIVLPLGLDGRDVDEAFVGDIIKTLGMGRKCTACQIPFPEVSSSGRPFCGDDYS